MLHFDFLYILHSGYFSTGNFLQIQICSVKGHSVVYLFFVCVRGYFPRTAKRVYMHQIEYL